MINNKNLKNLSSSQVYSKILKEINEMSEKELLKQDGYYNLLDTIAMSMLKKGETPIHLTCSSTDTLDTGCTDGKVIMINTWSPIVLAVQKMDEFIKGGKSPKWATVLPTEYNVRYLMYLCNVGTVAHEFGHVMYTDFALLNKIRERIYKGDFTGCKEEEKLSKLYAMPEFKNIVVQNIFDLMNIIEDCYIENCLCLEYPKQGNVVRGLETGNLMKYFMSSSIVTLEKRIEEGKTLLPDAFLWMLQIQNCLGYTPKHYDEAKGPVHEILDATLKKAKKDCENYKLSSENHKEEVYSLIDILASLYPDPDVAQAMMDATGESEGEGGQGKGEDKDASSSGDNDGQKSKEDIINSQRGNSTTEGSSKDLKKDSGQSNDDKFSRNNNKAKRDPSKTKTEADQAEADKAKDLAKSNTVQDKDISKELAKEVTEEIKAAAQSADLQKAYQELEKKGLVRNGGKSTKVEAIKVCDYEKDLYDEYYRDVEKTAKACVRKVGQILEKREFDEEESGFVQGFKFNAHEAYRKDKKVFSRELVPDSKPNVAFTIMVDESGSMCGEKNEKAIETAILFDEISRELGIPTQIVGHTELGHPIAKSYRNFDTNDKERYNLAKITAHGGNIDTIILSGLCEQMLSRPEDKKVVIVISDGEPCGIYTEKKPINFRGVPFKDLDDYEMEELNACVRYYRKKGIKIIGIAIDDAKNIKKIYEDGFLDCTDLKKLPVEMVKIFKRYVLK